MTKDDNEATTQPIVNKSELEILKEQLEVAMRENEILTKQTVKLKLENERLLNEQAKDKYITRDYSQEPTDEEAKVLKAMQPQGRQVSASIIAQILNINITTAQNHLNELESKDCVKKHAKRGAYGRGTPQPMYSLEDKGVKYLVDHNLTE